MYFQSPTQISASHKPGVFIGGGISNCPNWQQDIAELIDCERFDVFNPRRKGDLAKTGEDTKKQIEWEFNALKVSDIVLFWFPKESVCPITLFEYGKMLVELSYLRLQKIIVGCDAEYPRVFDIGVQTSLMDLSSQKLMLVEGYDAFRAMVAEELGK